MLGFFSVGKVLWDVSKMKLEEAIVMQIDAIRIFFKII
jgi:hypothetical protein